MKGKHNIKSLHHPPPIYLSAETDFDLTTLTFQLSQQKIKRQRHDSSAPANGFDTRHQVQHQEGL